LYQFGTILNEGGELDDARDVFERICKIHTSSLTTDKTQKLQYLETLLSLIPLRLTLKKYDLAHQEGKALAQLLRDLYPENGSTLSSVAPATDSHLASQQSNDSIGEAHEANSVRSNAFGVVAMTLIWNETCDHAKAKEYLLQSLRSRQLRYGKIHTTTAFTSHLLAIVCRKLKEFQLAIHYHHMAIRMYEILLGEKNLVTLSSVGELGITIQSRASYQVHSNPFLLFSLPLFL
jgi:tetratricopeptide (TPR) repeat protein